VLVVEIELAKRARDDGLLVIGVVDDEIPGEADRRAVDAKELGARRVKGADPKVSREVVSEKLREARAHLPRGFVRERHREDAIGRDARLRDEVRHAVRDHAGLAASRPSEHEKRAARMRRGLGLRVVQLGSEGGSHGTQNVA
jgi:hypothetical protein